MTDVLKEYSYRKRVALQANHKEVAYRLIGLLDWMESVRPVKKVMKSLLLSGRGETRLAEAIKTNEYRHYDKDRTPPNLYGLEEIASFGCAFIILLRDKNIDIVSLSALCGIEAKRWGDNYRAEAAVSRYIVPFLDYVEQRLPILPSQVKIKGKNSFDQPPAVIHDSLQKFQNTNRDLESTCFIMMRFGKTTFHKRIEKAIKSTLEKHKITGLLARDTEYHDDLFPNILTYMHGCAFGIAVFERLETNEFNPNVALEVGYMIALRKPVLLLKDKTLHALHTDLVGRLYREFDPQNPVTTIPAEIERWLTDRGLA